MEFEKYYLPLKRIKGTQQTREVVGNIKIVKNGNRYVLFVYSQYKEDFKTMEIFEGGILVEKFNILPENVLNFKINKQCFCAVLYGQTDFPLCAAGNYALKEKFEQDKEIEKLIDFYLQKPTFKKRKGLKETLFCPLFRTKKLRYYKNIEANLKSVLINFPRELVLENMFLNSRWAKAETNGKIIVVGVVFNNNVPQKIGVGFPSLKGQKQTLNKKCGTLKFYAIDGQKNLGYYLNFKDATTGKDI